ILLDNKILIPYFISPIKEQKGCAEYHFTPVPVHPTEPLETYHHQDAAAPEFQLSPSLLNGPGYMMYTVDNIRRYYLY
ncbi:TPA: hypothetical protein ACIBMP_004079, partial [Salmonella enterica subsp. enterica serovar Adelaide]